MVRVNPETNLVEKRIEVSGDPLALAIGENSIWVLCLKGGKVEQIDRKTNKVSKTIELVVPGATEGGIAFSTGAIWVTMTGFPRGSACTTMNSLVGCFVLCGNLCEGSAEERSASAASTQARSLDAWRRAGDGDHHAGGCLSRERPTGNHGRSRLGFEWPQEYHPQAGS